MLTLKNPASSPANWVFLCLFAFSQPSQAATPLQTHDLNPLTLIYGLPLVTSARIPGNAFSILLNASNTLNIENTATESLFIDGETNELNLLYSYNVNDKTSIRLKLPYISHQAGSLDGFIDDFHNTFGFPQGQRPNTANDQFLFSYQTNNVEQLGFTEANQGIGDITIESAYQLQANAQTAASLWTSLKLPSGDLDILTGSGKTDVAIWYAAENNFSNDWSRYYNIGLLLVGNARLLNIQQKTEVYFGTAGLEWRLANRVTLNVQFDFHTAFYQSDLNFLGDSIQISSGGHIKLSDKSRINIIVVEDIQVGASPDVTFQLGYSQLL